MRSARGRTSLCLALAVLLGAPVARSQPTAEPVPGPAPPAEDASEAPAPPAAEGGWSATVDEVLEPKVDVIEGGQPPPTDIVYLQYGVAFAAEIVSAAGPICDTPAAPCILGPGGGITVRAGWRGAGPLYLGGAYELTKQDPSKLYRIALLQQARAEARYYLMNARVTEPYGSASLGVAGYGNEWSIDTWGPGGSLGVGIEYQVTQRTVIGVALNYRVLYFSRFTDTSGAARDPGIAQLVGFDLVLEQRDPSFTPEKSSSTAATAR